MSTDNQSPSTNSIQKLETGIPGFDFISGGGLPKGRSSLISGTSGSGKTVFAGQFLAEGIRAGAPGVFITFEEPAEDIMRNLASLGWPIAQWIEEKKWAFVDASPQYNANSYQIGEYDLGGLMARIEHAVRDIHAKRLSIDSIGAVFSQFSDQSTIRRELFRIASGLKLLDVTAVLTAERVDEFGPVSRHGIEEFVADNVIILRNVLQTEKRRRTLEILKFRGTHHQKGEYPFIINSDQGIVIVPLSSMELKQKSSTTRVPTGISKLDDLCGGGYFKDSVILVSGATGTGKTLTSSHFISAAVQNDEKSLLFGFEESRFQLIRNAEGWGMGFEQYEQDGLLKLICDYPESMGLEDRLLAMKQAIEEYQPKRIVVDSLSAVERIATLKSFREFVIALSSFIKKMEITCMMTSTTTELLGGTSITEAHISTLTDSIILLRYVELFGEMQRGITVLKMRGSGHDKNIHEFRIGKDGMSINKPFRNISGILGGRPFYTVPGELERLDELFKDQQDTEQ